MAERVGFIGLGIMGAPMARNLIRAGFTVTVYNRTASKCEPLLREGAKRASCPREAAEGKDVTITVVTDSPDVEEVVLGPQGAAEGAPPGSVVIDMSTIAPGAARRIGETLKTRGIHFLDAPVSGGDIGAVKGTLTIMVGGEREVFERVKDVFEAMGSTITHVGPLGSGQATKACNQVLCAVTLLGVCEAMALARRSGLDLDVLLRVLTGGAGNSWTLSNLGPKIAGGDYAPGFMVKLLGKDLAIVLDAARTLRLPLGGTALADAYLRSNEAHGEGDLGTQAMFRVLERLGDLER